MKIEHKSEYLDGDKRYYIGTDDNKYISTTTLLSLYEDKTGLEAWKNKIGHDRAEEIGKAATEQGKAVHAEIESLFEIANFSATDQRVANLSPHARMAYNSFYRHVKPLAAEQAIFFNDGQVRFAGRLDHLVTIPANTFKVKYRMELVEDSYQDYYVPESKCVADLKTKFAYAEKKNKTSLPQTHVVNYILSNCMQVSTYAKQLDCTSACIVYVNETKSKVIRIDSDGINFYWNWFYALLEDYYEIKKLTATWKDIIKEAHYYVNEDGTPLNFIPQELLL